MTNKLIETLWRADRVLAGAVALVALAAGGIAGATIMERPAINPPTEQVAVAPPAPEPAPPSDLLDAATLQLIAEHKCLSEALYYEARGEGVSGQMAVAEVIFHRLRDKGFPRTICGVVYQGKHAKGCQFSFTCNGRMKAAKNRTEWDQAQMLASKILTGTAAMRGLTDEATHFHAISVQPVWAGHLQRTIQIGNHIFYRELPRNKRS